MLQGSLCLIYAGIFIFIVLKWNLFKIKELQVKYIVGTFVLKLLVGIFFWKIYITTYSINDATAFFNDSKVLYDSFFEDPSAFFKMLFGLNDPALATYTAHMPGWSNDFNTFFINDSRTMIRFNALIRFFSFGYYSVHTIVACFCSLLGLTLIYKAVIGLIPDRAVWLFLVVFISPSLLFWSSGVFKESVVFVGIGMFLFHSEFGLRKKYTWTNIAGVIVGLFLMLNVKFYVLLAMLPGIIANHWITRTKQRRILLKYAVVSVFLLIALFTIPRLLPQYDLLKNLKNKQVNFNKMARGGVYLNAGDDYFIYVDYAQSSELLKEVAPGIYSLKDKMNYKKFKRNTTDTTEICAVDWINYKLEIAIPPAGSAIYIKPVETDPVGFVSALPRAFFNTLLLPQLFKVPYSWKLLSLITNLGYLLFIFISLFFSRIKREHSAYLLFILSFIVVLFSLIGLTTPILGAIVRYRVPALPFLGILMLLLVDREKLERFFKRKKTAN